MQQIIVRPRNQEELQLVTQLMKRMKIKVDIEEETPKTKRKQEILESIERSAREVNAAIQEGTKLKSARELLDEL